MLTPRTKPKDVVAEFWAHKTIRNPQNKELKDETKKELFIGDIMVILFLAILLPSRGYRFLCLG
jgi:hypothetical protein